jgi:hypothetical protein
MLGCAQRQVNVGKLRALDSAGVKAPSPAWYGIFFLCAAVRGGAKQQKTKPTKGVSPNHTLVARRILIRTISKKGEESDGRNDGSK